MTECAKCSNPRYAHGLCRSHYGKQVDFGKSFLGRRIDLIIPFGKKKEVTQYYEAQRQAILFDAHRNPKKWLRPHERRKTT